LSSNSKQNREALWHWAELEAACNLLQSGVELEITGISIDSRSVLEGELFIALEGDPGPRFKSSSQGLDGHKFVGSAEEQGAAGLMVSKPVASSLPTLHVQDTLDGLWQLGEAGRNRMAGKVVAITGSSGKTTLRQWTEQVLAEQAMIHASVGSFNNHWGVPLSLARMPRQAEYGIFEVGMNHPGEISPLASLVRPDVAVVLNVLPAHIGQFESLAHIRREKLSIEDGLRSSGILIVPDDLVTQEIATCNIMTFGFGEAATVRGRIIPDPLAPDSTSVEVKVEDASYFYTLEGKGEHRVLTSLALMAIIYALDADLAAASAAMAKITTPEGRGNRIRVGSTVLVDDSYNANPVSMAYALRALAASKAEKKIAFLGEMFELGQDGDAAHLALQSLCLGIDRIITVGDGFKIWRQDFFPAGVWRHYENVASIPLSDLFAELSTASGNLPPVTASTALGSDHTDALLETARTGSIEILIKGSNKVFWVCGFAAQVEQYLQEMQGEVIERV